MAGGLTGETVAGNKEIERKFLIPAAGLETLDLTGFESTHIRQGYLSVDADGNEVRLRDRDDFYTQTYKSKGGVVRGELETELSARQFVTFWPATEGRRVEKTRYAIPYNESVIELDVYEGDLDGLVVAEVEFPDEASADAFEVPDFFGTEVSEDKAYKNQQLAMNGVPASHASLVGTVSVAAMFQPGQIS